MRKGMARSEKPQFGRRLTIAACTLALLALGFVWLRQSAQDSHALQIKEDAKPPSPFFRHWDQPQLAIVLTGQMYGYLQPCGCSEPQYGGLARRFNLIRSLKDKGWPVVAMDLGDLAAHSSPQDLLKFETTMQALEVMGYTAVGLGRNEFYLPLINALAFKVNHKPADPPYLVSSNLNDGLKLVKP
jgi:2',3'-cyclic-nucleotide 2'-phosphodiesterase (5'-nucleotidase family)